MTDQLATAAARQQVIKQHRDDPFIILMTLVHAQLKDGPLYVARNRKKFISRGNTYLAYPFEPELPGDGDESPQGRVSIANVARRIGRTIEGLIEPPQVTFELVLASDPDTVQNVWDGFEFSQVTWDKFRMTGTVELPDTFNEPWPNVFYEPSGFPGLFPNAARL